MQIQFQLSFDDYRAAQQLHARRSFWSRLGPILTNYIFPACGLCFLAAAFCLDWRKTSAGTLLAIGLPGLYLVFSPFYLRMRLKSCYKRTRTDAGDCLVTIDTERILVEAKSMKSEIDWPAVQRFRENDKVFMLYIAPAKFIAIPKRACTEAQIGELRALLLQEVKPLIQ